MTYSDDQITLATGLHRDNLRKLITWGAVRPIQSGGGRGRTRGWSLRQALRISITSQFVDVGFSLRMAHTLTYCMPIDDLLYVYDPEVLKRVQVKGSDWTPSDQHLLDALTRADWDGEWPDSSSLGAQTVIVDGRYLYSDALGDGPLSCAIIDRDAQRVIPVSADPLVFMNIGMAENLRLPRIVDATSIDTRSLLIDPKYLGKSKAAQARRFKCWPKDMNTQLIGVDDQIFRSMLIINFAAGFIICVRRLDELPVNFTPCKVERRE